MSQTALEGWVGREEVVRDELALHHARAVAAMLDRPPEAITPGTALPPLWHWFYFYPVTPASELGPDGHARRGGFLPPVMLPRRMWAGGRLVFGEGARIGQGAERRSRIQSVEEKQGRSGRLALVTVGHEIVQDGRVAVTEEQDVVYREAPDPAAAQPAPTPAPPAEWEARVTTDPVLLFRFSALTFNGHRIHYDWRYTTEVEGYPGLVVHGPLLALLLLDHACERVGRLPATFSYRALSPLFCGEEILIGGRVGAGGEEELWAADRHGALAMRATITWKG